ncbi:hypothetical protein N9A94_01955 [Akkermansiaceae bacterium]|nr:hypothetical protein [Akkermansiaceae bacterium]
MKLRLIIPMLVLALASCERKKKTVHLTPEEQKAADEAHHKMILELTKVEPDNYREKFRESLRKSNAASRQRKSDEKRLVELETEATRLRKIYEEDPNLRTEGEWKETRKAALLLQWKLYPSTRPAPSPKSDMENKIEDLGDQLEDLQDSLERR